MLQKYLGPQFCVVEEGLNSRTTSLDYSNVPGKNGLAALPAILKSRAPIDFFILSLGTNDLKHEFDWKPAHIGESIEKLVDCVRRSAASVEGQEPIIHLVAPPIPKLKFVYDSFRYPELEAKARELAPVYRSIAEKHELEFLDLGALVESSDVDGVHLDPEQHLKIAEKVTELVKRLLPV